MKSFLKKFHIRFFDWPLDFRVRLFHILAFGGIAISFFTVTISLIMGMWETAGLAAVLIVFSLGLILFTQRTGKYQIAYFLTVTVIFMVVLPMMFFTSGGHRSGMPSIFLLAVLFTVLMIKGKAALLISLLEIAEYSAVCVFAYYNPEFVTHYETEGQILVDIIFAFTCVSLICGVVLFFHLREYDRQRELLYEQNEKLRRYDASRSVFLTTVSHEVKNPLNAINLYARDTLELMGEEALNLAPMRLSKLLKEVSGTYFGKDASGGNELVLDIDENLLPISADYARIVQVVTNLLSNAIQHTKAGRIRITLYKQGGEQIVVIADNGEGMKEELQEQVFKGYISSDKEYWRHGIGLYVSHQIIEAHGGRIWIESKLGEGTTVTFTLPDEEK